MAHKSKTNSRSITKIDRRVLHDTCYIVHQFQDQKVKGQGHRPTRPVTLTFDLLILKLVHNVALAD